MKRNVPLGELIKAAGSRAGSEVDLPVYSVTKHFGFVPSLEYFKKQVFSRDVQGYKVVEPGQFAYATIHLDEGSIGISPERSLISPMYTVFSVDDMQVVPEYLFRFLKSPRAIACYPQLGKGAVHRRKAISLSALGSLQVPLPPLDEQRRIAAILDQADAIRTKRRRVVAHLHALRQATFHSMFHDRCDRVAISTFAEVRTGSTPSRNDPENYGGVIPWVKTGEVQGGVINATSESVTERGARSARLRVFPAGSVVVAMYGNGKTRGQSAVLGIPATTNQACAVILPNDRYVPEFLQTQLVIEYERLRGGAEGGNQSNLSLGRVANFDVQLPPVALQREFAARVSFVNTQIAVVERALAGDDELFASLQFQAFRGAL